MPYSKKSLILASSSPRRLMLLEQIGIKPDLVIHADIDETHFKNELPKNYSIRIAKEKVLAVLENPQVKNFPDPIILSCDTVVAMGRRILPKAENEEQVRNCLELMSGRRHKIYSSVCVANLNKKIQIKTAISTIKLKNLSPAEIDFYVKSGEGIGKAGGYAIQAYAATFASFMSGSYSGIVGLPLYETGILLKNFGY